MHDKKTVILKTLLNQYTPELQSELVSLLSNDLKQSLATCSYDQSDITIFISQKQAALQSMHYSWIVKLLEDTAENLQQFLIAGLSSEQLKGLAKIGLKPISSAKVFHHFFAAELEKLLQLDHLLPREMMPKSRFESLLFLSKDQLLQIIDLLGLFDLSLEVKKILDRDTLRQIYAALSQTEVKFLKVCLHARNRSAKPGSMLKSKPVEKKLLRQNIYQKGLLRFCLAISDEDQNFWTYLAWKFDIGRGKLILDQLQKKHKFADISSFQKQLLEVVKFIT